MEQVFKQMEKTIIKDEESSQSTTALVDYFKDSALQEVYDSVMQFPFMSDKKCVILDDFDFEDCSKTDFEKKSEVFSVNTFTIRIV